MLLALVRAGGAGGAGAAPSAPDLDRRPAARRLRALSEPRLHLVRRSVDDKGRLRGEIVVEDIRKLLSFFHLSAAEGGRRIAIIDAAARADASVRPANRATSAARNARNSPGSSARARMRARVSSPRLVSCVVRALIAVGHAAARSLIFDDQRRPLSL